MLGTTIAIFRLISALATITTFFCVDRSNSFYSGMSYLYCYTNLICVLGSFFSMTY
jgi:hypothetical protein